MLAVSSHLPQSLLREAKDVVALPRFSFELQQRGMQGLLIDSQQRDLVEASLPALWSLPQRSDLQLDSGELDAQLTHAFCEAAVVEEAAIFGGYLYRHFGHFCHESLSRLWWLGEGDQQHGLSREVCGLLRDQQLDVYFFTPKDLLPYMQEILTGLGLGSERIRIMTKPLLFRRLLMPAQAWGLDYDYSAIDQRLGCDGKALMRSLFAGFHRLAPSEPSSQSAAAAPAKKVYVTRSGLPVQLGRPIGDRWLDEVLRDAGYLVFNPEQHSVRRQVEVFSEAAELVFVDGSAMYPLWFARLRPEVRITIILRRSQGLWMLNKVRDLMPTSCSIRWQVIDAIVAQDLTSANDWQSHNLLDLGAIARQILAPRPVRESAQAEQALSRNLQELATQLGPEPMGRILEVLIRRFLVVEPRPQRRLISRLSQCLRRLLRFGP
jgi:hypothetical protein